MLHGGLGVGLGGVEGGLVGGRGELSGVLGWLGGANWHCGRVVNFDAHWPDNVPRT